MNDVFWMLGVAAVAVIVVGIAAWILWREGQKGSAKSSGTGPVVTLGCPGYQVDWPPEDVQKSESPKVPPASDLRTCAPVDLSTTIDHLARFGKGHGPSRRENFPPAWELVKRHGSSTVAAFLERALAGDVEFTDLVFMAAVCNRARVERMRKIGAGVAHPPSGEANGKTQ